MWDLKMLLFDELRLTGFLQCGHLEVEIVTQSSSKFNQPIIILKGNNFGFYT